MDVLVDELQPEVGPDERAIVRDYVAATLEAMPDYFRLGFRVLALVFDLWSIPRHGRRFSSLGPAERYRQLVAWRNGRLSFQRSMVAFYGTFTTFGLYSIVYRADCPKNGRIAA